MGKARLELGVGYCIFAARGHFSRQRQVGRTRPSLIGFDTDFDPLAGAWRLPLCRTPFLETDRKAGFPSNVDCDLDGDSDLVLGIRLLPPQS